MRPLLSLTVSLTCASYFCIFVYLEANQVAIVGNNHRLIIFPLFAIYASIFYRLFVYKKKYLKQHQFYSSYYEGRDVTGYYIASWVLLGSGLAIPMIIRLFQKGLL